MWDDDLRGISRSFSPASWRLAPDWTARLRELGMRGDIIKQMHAALHGDPARYRVLGPNPRPSARRRVALLGDTAEPTLCWASRRSSLLTIVDIVVPASIPATSTRREPSEYPRRPQ
jgi:hypothetical protein